MDANLEIHEDPAGQPDEVRSVDQVGQAKKEHLLKEKVHPIHQRQWCTAYDELVVQKRPRRALNEADAYQCAQRVQKAQKIPQYLAWTKRSAKECIVIHLPEVTKRY